MEKVFSILITLILLMAVIFGIKMFDKAIQEDIKDFKEKYKLTKKLLSNFKNK